MKQVLGYFFGFAIFIAGIPALMWLVSGMPALADIPVGRLYLLRWDTKLRPGPNT